MDVKRVVGIGKAWQGRVRRYFDPPLGPDAPPLEVAQAVLDQVESRIEPVGRGRRVFPYTRLRVRVVANGDAVPGFEAAFDRFEARVRERLDELRCEQPVSLVVELNCDRETPATWSAGQVHEVLFERDTSGDVRPSEQTGEPRGSAPAPPTLHVTVIAGRAESPTQSFRQSTIAIGRTTGPTDDDGRVRRNRVAFADVVDGISETVGRAHARLKFEAETGVYRLYDEGSRNGTAIVRDGEVIPVARRDPRGVRVRSGDEIQVGRAVVRVEVEG